MKPRTWLIQTLALAAGMAVVVMSLNAWFDIYGIFRSARGRKLVVHGDERIAKYLFSERYVPENFDAILIGSSVSANWRTQDIQGLRVYNESLNGGNIVEEKALVDRVLARPGMKFAFVVVHPYLTALHEFETVRLTPRENLAALGSQSLLTAYEDMLNQKFRPNYHPDRTTSDEFGTNNFEPPEKLNATLERMMRPTSDFEVDEGALHAYYDLISELRAHSVRIVFIVPPVSQRLLQLKRDAFAKYFCIIQGSMSDRDTVLDFSSDEFAALLCKDENFGDGVHMHRAAVPQFMQVLNVSLRGAMPGGEPRLRSQPASCARPGIPSP
jgi:hypothetical protein